MKNLPVKNPKEWKPAFQESNTGYLGREIKHRCWEYINGVYDVNTIHYYMRLGIGREGISLSWNKNIRQRWYDKFI